MYDRRPVKPTMHPRRVVGGIRLQFRAANAPALPATSDDADDAQAPEMQASAPGATTPPAVATTSGPLVPVIPSETSPGWSWASARLMRLAETYAPGDQLALGFEYAQLGQTRTMEIKPGLVSARVQGRMPSGYKVTLRLPTFTPEQWEPVTSAMSAQAKYAAALLAGELPSNIEDLFAPAGLNLFPTEPSALGCSCECDIFKAQSQAPAALRPASRTKKGAPQPPPHQPWCKHICCVMYLVAERLAQQPLTIFSIRGLPEGDLIERLRQHRALAGLQRAGGATAPVYQPHLSNLPRGDTPLEESALMFWTSAEPDALDALDMPIEPPEVSHPLLRRVGPSPFTGSKFPLVGLLATCYDVISESAIRGETERPTEGMSLDGGDPSLDSGHPSVD